MSPHLQELLESIKHVQGAQRGEVAQLQMTDRISGLDSSCWGKEA